KPLPQEGAGSIARLLGGTVAVILLLGVALAVFFLCHRQQKDQLGTDDDGTDQPPSQKPEPPPNRQSYLGPEDIQILQLEAERQRQEEELQKLSLQPPYCDLGVSPSYYPLVRATE
uniref:Uncharacterized protein n=1 Tax=Otolemur garnettii TaxID=30611 RepID=H0XJR5_OTOGA